MDNLSNHRDGETTFLLLLLKYDLHVNKVPTLAIKTLAGLNVSRFSRKSGYLHGQAIHTLCVQRAPETSSWSTNFTVHWLVERSKPFNEVRISILDISFGELPRKSDCFPP